ncbi:HD domain-containing protein [Candidatus Pelagibacter sp.]|jgi:(p)ppGpp synthase/HD superfamily hydrolase|nr:HD domain-containing protein [Candidatus Pelagibacter sp.]
MLDKKKYKKALDFAYKIHFDQNRKKTKIPYFTHLVSVSNHVIEDGGNTDEAIGGLLHDAVEDQGGLKTLKKIRKLFGNNVAKIVNECSDTIVVPKPPWLARKKKYISDIKKKGQSSMFVSLCDKLHNGTSIVNDYKRKGKKVWTRFTASPKQVAWYYESLYKEFSKHLKGHKVLKDNYLTVVKDIKKAASK